MQPLSYDNGAIFRKNKRQCPLFILERKLMNTFVIGDLHLQAKEIIHLIKPLIQIHSVEHIIFVGDYVDQWNQTGNDSRYISELDTLIEFKNWCSNMNIKTTFLLGNHDVPYLIYNPQPYSSDSASVREYVRKKLLELNPKLAIESHGYMISHAGFVANTKATNNLSLDNLIAIESEDGFSSLNKNVIPSSIWARPYDHKRYPSQFYKKQIFGHTPVESIHLSSDLINIDTFSLYRSLRPIGDGSILLLSEEKPKKINTNWDMSKRKEF